LKLCGGLPDVAFAEGEAKSGGGGGNQILGQVFWKAWWIWVSGFICKNLNLI